MIVKIDLLKNLDKSNISYTCTRKYEKLSIKDSFDKWFQNNLYTVPLGQGGFEKSPL